MESKNEKISELAAMFSNIDLEIIENIFEVCEGKLNKTAEMLLKMQEDNQLQSEPLRKSNDPILSEKFLELDDDEQEKTPAKEPGFRNPEEVVLENEMIEQEYMAEMQKAIALSLESSKKTSAKPQSQKKVEKTGKVETGQIVPESPDEEIIEFVFQKNCFIRGENYLNN